MVKLGSADETDVLIGKRIRDRRQQIGVTQHALAKTIGVSFQQLHKYEQGTNRVSAARLWRIAKALQTPMDYYFAAEGERQATAQIAAEEAKLLQAYRDLPGGAVRDHLWRLVQAMAHWNSAQGSRRGPADD